MQQSLSGQRSKRGTAITIRKEILQKADYYNNSPSSSTGSLSIASEIEWSKKYNFIVSDHES